MNRDVVLITGAARGIGRECAIQFAKKGYNVVINYNNSEEKAIDLKEKLIEEYKVDAIAIHADISIENDIKKMVEEAITKFEKIDVLVNNAGIAIDTLFEDKTKENFLKILNVNTIGTFLVTKYVAKKMMEKKKGNIINITSTNAIDTFYPMGLDYDASKAAVISITHNCAKQFAPYIRVNAIASGWIDTDMNKDMDDEFKNDEIKKIFLKRFGKPEEIAKVVYFLASKDSSYINGEIIRVDGGY